jgi:ABC-type amino acid transport substrate-binding protein
MCSVFRRLHVIAFAFAAVLSVANAQDCCGDLSPASPRINADGRRVLRVAADPNNLPFSNQRLEGFENKLAALVAKDLGAELEYSWRAQRRGFFREMLKEGRCDLVMGVPAGFEMGLTTKPYYRSSYVFVTRKDRDLKLASLDDSALTNLTIGVQLVGDDGANPPAAHALARRAATPCSAIMRRRIRPLALSMPSPRRKLIPRSSGDRSRDILRKSVAANSRSPR